AGCVPGRGDTGWGLGEPESGRKYEPCPGAEVPDAEGGLHSFPASSPRRTSSGSVTPAPGSGHPRSSRSRSTQPGVT
ncbi:hypothetical protein P7K49_014639, partial [Saguinus oedipus]